MIRRLAAAAVRGPSAVLMMAGIYMCIGAFVGALIADRIERTHV